MEYNKLSKSRDLRKLRIPGRFVSVGIVVRKPIGCPSQIPISFVFFVEAHHTTTNDEVVMGIPTCKKRLMNDRKQKHTPYCNVQGKHIAYLGPPAT